MNRRNTWDVEEPTLEDLINNKTKAPLDEKENRKVETHPMKKDTKAKRCCRHFKEYTSCTSLHGLQYVGDDERPKTERVWWAIMFILSLSACIYLIMKVWIKWDNIPVIVNFAESSTPIWQIPFPAVTFCPATKSIQSIFNYTDVYHKVLNGENLTDWEKQYFSATDMLCNDHVFPKEQNFTDQSIVNSMKDVAPQLMDSVFVCVWKNEHMACDKIFSPIITEEGLCYTFNMLDADEMFKKDMFHKDFQFVEHGNKSTGWNLHDGYQKDLPIDTFPRRGPGAGFKASLEIRLMSHFVDNEFLCRGTIQGYKVSLHTPSDVPRVSQNYVFVPHNQNVLVAVKPNMITASEELTNYDPAKRSCFFPYERKLKYFKHYSRDNCLFECFSNYTAHVCGCVPFFMPRDSETPICSHGKMNCADNAIDELLTRDIRKGLKITRVHIETEEERSFRKAKNRVAASCVCLSGCTSISYDVETSQSDNTFVEYFKAYRLDNVHEVFDMDSPYRKQREEFFKKNNITNYGKSPRGDKSLQTSTISIYFKEPEFIMSIRSELYGAVDFLANCGGLLGLCSGFSVLSLIEIFYFLSLRACCNIRNRTLHKNTHGEMELNQY